MRGSYKADAHSRLGRHRDDADHLCNKKFSKLATVTAGIFTVCCQHGTVSRHVPPTNPGTLFTIVGLLAVNVLKNLARRMIVVPGIVYGGHIMRESESLNDLFTILRTRFYHRTCGALPADQCIQLPLTIQHLLALLC